LKFADFCAHLDILEDVKFLRVFFAQHWSNDSIYEY
jgi:hypothetical protein